MQDIDPFLVLEQRKKVERLVLMLELFDTATPD
jgi:hypothetical protein